MSDEWIVVLEEDAKTVDFGSRALEMTVTTSFKAVPVGTKDLFDILFRKVSSTMSKEEAEQLASELQLAHDVLNE